MTVPFKTSRNGRLRTSGSSTSRKLDVKEDSCKMTKIMFDHDKLKEWVDGLFDDWGNWQLEENEIVYYTDDNLKSVRQVEIEGEVLGDD